MGLFDTVNVICPHCGEKNDLQSKAGECFMMHYDFENAPVGILDDLTGPHQCTGCQHEFLIKLVQKPIFVVDKKD